MADLLDTHLSRMKRARTRAAVINALRAGMPDMHAEVARIALGIIATLENDPLMKPTMRQCSTAQKFGRFTCHCGAVATRVNNLVGRCEAHALTLRDKASTTHKGRRRHWNHLDPDTRPPSGW